MIEDPSRPVALDRGAPAEITSEGDRASLYRAYRSLTFEEVVGQRHVTQTLRNAVRYGKVAHAYLFTGPRGTGKTSTARILARAVNCRNPHDGEPCNSCPSCVSMLQRRSLDLVEIDGASNNSVDDVRELRERVNLRPTEGARKVFIIDEVHMLSIGAFNALLKTLEEPPDHVLFVLATTELQKVPATVRSRCQLLELRQIATKEMIARLTYVCGREGISTDDDVLPFIAAQSTGSLRDALSLLEQIRAFCGDDLKLAEVEAALGVARNTQVVSLAGAMARGDLAESLLIAEELMDGGVDPGQLTRQLAGYWREALVARARQKPVDEPHVARCRADQIVPVLYSLMGVESASRRSDSPRWALETAIADATLRLNAGAGTPSTAAEQHSQATSVAKARADEDSAVRRREPPPDEPRQRAEPPRAGTVPEPMTPVEPAYLQEAPPPEVEIERPIVAQPTPDRRPREQAPDREAQPVAAADAGGTRRDGAGATMEAAEAQALWPHVLNRLREAHKGSVVALLQQNVIADRIEAENGVITFPLRPGMAFVREMLEKPATRKAIDDVATELTGGQWRIRCVTIDELTTTSPADLAALEYIDTFAAEVTSMIREHE